VSHDGGIDLPASKVRVSCRPSTFSCLISLSLSPASTPLDTLPRVFQASTTSKPKDRPSWLEHNAKREQRFADAVAAIRSIDEALRKAVDLEIAANVEAVFAATHSLDLATEALANAPHAAADKAEEAAVAAATHALGDAELALTEAKARALKVAASSALSLARVTLKHALPALVEAPRAEKEDKEKAVAAARLTLKARQLDHTKAKAGVERAAKHVADAAAKARERAKRQAKRVRAQAKKDKARTEAKEEAPCFAQVRRMQEGARVCWVGGQGGWGGLPL
jgi:hypothetical protein